MEIKPYKTQQNNPEHRPENREHREEPKCKPDLHTLITDHEAKKLEECPLGRGLVPPSAFKGEITFLFLPKLDNVLLFVQLFYQ